MQKGELACDPRGLIFESYRIEGIDAISCRPIFLDWALGVPDNDDTTAHIQTLLNYYGAKWPDHPMTEILRSGLEQITTPRRRKRR